MTNTPTPRGGRAWMMLMMLLVVAGIVGTTGYVLIRGAEEGQAVPPGPAEDGDYRYLALGDSLASGFDPSDRLSNPDRSYAAQVRDALQAGGKSKVELVDLACAGENTRTFIYGGVCKFEQNSQLGQALAEIAKPGPPVKVISLQLGANDVWPCSMGGGTNDACAQGARLQVSTTLDGMVRRLHEAAPAARITLVDYYNPFASNYIFGEGGQQWARKSSAAMQGVNEEIARAADRSGVRMAKVGDAFGYTDLSAGGDERPVAVARVCDLTNMCTQSDTHPNRAGHALIARIVVSAVGGDPAAVPDPSSSPVTPTTPATPSTSVATAATPPARP